MPGVVHWNHPRFFAYFPSGNSYPSVLGDMLSSAIGSIGFSWVSKSFHIVYSIRLLCRIILCLCAVHILKGVIITVYPIIIIIRKKMSEMLAYINSSVNNTGCSLAANICY